MYKVPINSIQNPSISHVPPYRGEEGCASQCWRERKLLLGPPMPDKSKGKGQTKCSPSSSMLRVGRGSNIYCYESMEAKTHRRL
jgi:hypothetical protein